jgi:hypothetical protein
MMFWLGGAVTVFYGLKVVAKVESFATWLLIGSMLLASFLALDRFQVWKLGVTDWSAALLPYGVFLFALSGLNVIPETVEIVHRNRSLARKAVTIGTFSAAILSWIFAVALSAALSGTVGRSPSDLMRALPNAAAWLIPFVGFFAVATSYITTAQDLTAALRHDYRASKFLAWMAALFVPFGILLVINRDFLTVIDVVGTVFGGINGILVALIAMRIYERKRIRDWRWEVAIPSFTATAYLSGILYKLFS